VAATAILAMAACGGDSGPAGPTVAVVINDTTFAPAEISVPAGGAVQWTSASKSERHTIIPVDAKAFKAHTDLIAPGESVTITFRTAGDYAYYCSIHGKPNAGQHGVVHVTAA
jgi:plastocyanin